MARGGRFFDVIEACYRVDLEAEAWMANVASTAASAVAGGLGLAALIYDSDHSGIAKRMHFADGCDPTWAESFLARIFDEHIGGDDHGTDRLARASAYVHAACASVNRRCTLLSAASGLSPFLPAVAAWGGARDMLLVQGFDPNGAGVWLGIPRKRLGALSSATAERCGRIATHLAVALRARTHLAGRPPLAIADAISAPDGRLLHARVAADDAGAKSALRRAVLALDRARARPVDDDASVLARKGLVDARWSLLDQFDSDGRRFVVAVHNEADVARHDALSERERQVLAHAALGRHNKEIAYDLGLAHTTVRVLVHRAAKKLGCKTRREAVERFVRARAREGDAQG